MTKRPWWYIEPQGPAQLPPEEETNMAQSPAKPTHPMPRPIPNPPLRGDDGCEDLSCEVCGPIPRADLIREIQRQQSEIATLRGALEATILGLDRDIDIRRTEVVASVLTRILRVLIWLGAGGVLFWAGWAAKGLT